MTSAERAKELLRAIERNAGLATRDEQIDRIASAITKAQNDKLEEAAKVALSFLDEIDGFHVGNALKALKSKD